MHSIETWLVPALFGPCVTTTVIHAPHGDGARTMPFWSSLSRVEKVIRNVEAYSSFSPAQIELRAFLDRWLPGLERDGLKVGLNWSGERAVGYDIEPQEVASRLAGALSADL
jgi:hypothetical protein